ncbi:MAG TPA: monovalent cation/H(+) antiporter subunit G [Actinomycetota bacterium]|nr:monovalent cation/H(+) antiporter subunit G [Actinomycetota bacterium]
MKVAASIFVLTGASLMVIAGVGLLRLPDVFSRMHAQTKAATLGLACILTGTALSLPGPAVAKVVLALVFQLITAPVAAHMIGRAAYRAGVTMWEGTLYDELGSHGRAAEEAPGPRE